MKKKWRAALWVVIGLCLADTALAWEDSSPRPAWLSPVEIHGYGEGRVGWRPEKGPAGKDLSPLEARFQGDLSAVYDRVELKLKADVWADGVTEEMEDDVREAWLFARAGENIDMKVGRQILTWGTGDLVFLNDLFPKDWQAFFIGRDGDYLKAPSDAAKISLFTSLVNIDLIYTPRFDPDRYIDGTYISQRTDSPATPSELTSRTDTPDRWFKDHETAIRLYRNIRNYEIAAYGYKGFWKQPSGRSREGGSWFPDLEVYGASARGQAGAGIANLEVAWYRSLDDLSGEDPLVNNSEMRYLVGYAQDITGELKLSLQFYVEELLKYQAYTRTHEMGAHRDRHRQVITCRLEQPFFNQTLLLDLSAYYSPTDKDAYLRPLVLYKWSDQVQMTAGANIFTGRTNHTFFGQFEDNTNIYASIRYAF